MSNVVKVKLTRSDIDRLRTVGIYVEIDTNAPCGIFGRTNVYECFLLESTHQALKIFSSGCNAGLDLKEFLLGVFNDKKE